ncbi:MAG: DUF4918 family protein [Bacteroidales bacterium]|nr:DUF4918 family protein [Bacteroidales bacterium]
MTFAHKVISFYKSLNYSGPLPAGINIMNPFRENDPVVDVISKFYNRFYNDSNPRKLILGINPGRFGAGVTGIPFTDTIRLNEKCGIRFDRFRTYEPSSSFIYDMIEAYGGVEKFYGRFFVSAVCPLGFTRINAKGKEVNCNYYDDPALIKMIYRFITDSMAKQIQLGIDTSACICLGTGKNDTFLRKLNAELHFFENMVTLEHPRFIMQYRAKRKEEYIRKYVEALNDVIGS